MYQLKYRKQARNYLARLPLKIKTIIIDKLHEIAANPDLERSDIKSLRGREGYRLRVGQYRVIYPSVAKAGGLQSQGVRG